MGSVEKRRQRLADGTLGKVTWRARYRDVNGRTRSCSFVRRFDAERFLEANGSDIIPIPEWLCEELAAGLARRASFQRHEPLIVNKQGRAVNRDTFRARVVRPPCAPPACPTISGPTTSGTATPACSSTTAPMSWPSPSAWATATRRSRCGSTGTSLREYRKS